MNGLNAVFGFNTVRTDILHGSGPNGTWNKSEIFKAAPILIHTGHDQFVPIHSCTYFNNYGINIFFKNGDAKNFVLYHGSLKLIDGENIGSASQNEVMRSKAIEGAWDLIFGVNYD